MPIGPNDTVTNNYGFVLPQIGGDVGTWGGIINTYLTSQLDAILGGVQTATLTNVPYALPLSQWQAGGVFRFTGLTGNVTVQLPLSPNASGGTPAVAGRFIIDNQTSGSFTLTCNTVVTGSTGVIVPQGRATLLYSDGTNVYYADAARPAGFALTAADPNGAITGNPGNIATGVPIDTLWDETDRQLFVAIGGTNWSSIGPAVLEPGGYLTPDPSVPVITSDRLTWTSIYYLPFRGNRVPIWNGVSFTMVPIPSANLLVLSGSVGIAGNTGYDIFAFNSANQALMGFSPAWTLPNSRPGTIQYLNGILVNSGPITLQNPTLGGPVAIPSFLATYLGSVWTDPSGASYSITRRVAGGGGNATCGLWNYYHRQPIALLVSEPTASWTYNGLWRPVNGNINNSVVPFVGVAEETIDVDLDHTVSLPASASNTGFAGLSLNLTSSFTPVAGSMVGQFNLSPATSNNVAWTASLRAKFMLAQGQALGLNTITALEQVNAGNTGTFFGQQSMLLTARYRG